MKTFKRSEDYLAKIFDDALDGEVHMDVKLQCIQNKGKLRIAYYDDSLKNYLTVKAWVQFPRALRVLNKIYIADIVKCGTKRKSFYRAYKGSIRDQDENILG